MTLSKGEILNCISNDSIDKIYYINPEDCIIEKNENPEQITEGYDTTFYNVTGLKTARDAWELDGTGMKVGLLEGHYYPDEDEATTHTMYYAGPSAHHIQISSHSTVVAKLMVGCKDDYLGPIPNAQLYYDALFMSRNRIKPKIEELLDCGVTAINMSFQATQQYNTYDDYARWYDHVIIQHNVHLIVSAGNSGSLGVPNSNTAYNVITVGNCDNDGYIHRNQQSHGITSSYCSTDPYPYKPDLVAPGTDIEIIPQYYAPGDPQGASGQQVSGTSFAAPMVTSAVIQMAQENSLLLSNPKLMKSLLISSSKITDGMVNDPVYSSVGSDDIAYSRVYGAGMLYVPNAHIAFHNNSYYEEGILSENNPSDIFSSSLRRVNGKKLRVCLTWDKVCTINGDHLTESISETTLSLLRLKVTDPNGNEYTSTYANDNKQMVTILPQINGNYQFEVELLSSETDTTNYAISWSLANST